MRKRILAFALIFMVLFSAAPVFAHGDDGDHDEPMQIQTPGEVPGPAHTVLGMPMEIIPNLHPLFVHFTIALLLIATLLFVVGKLTPVSASWRGACLTVARWNLMLGVLITIGTVLAGFYAFNTVNHDNFSHLPMLSHRLWALSTAGFFVILGLWSFATRGKEPQLLFVFCLVIASAALAVTLSYHAAVAPGNVRDDEAGAFCTVTVSTRAGADAVSLVSFSTSSSWPDREK